MSDRSNVNERAGLRTNPYRHSGSTERKTNMEGLAGFAYYTSTLVDEYGTIGCCYLVKECNRVILPKLFDSDLNAKI